METHWLTGKEVQNRAVNKEGQADSLPKYEVLISLKKMRTVLSIANTFRKIHLIY